MDHDRDPDSPTRPEPAVASAPLPPDERDGDDERFDAAAPAEAIDAAAADIDAADADADADAATERLRDLVVYLAVSLTDDPDAVEVLAERRGQTVHLNLRVPEEELGKVIGRQGRIARAMRTVLTIAGSRQSVRATLDIDN